MEDETYIWLQEPIRIPRRPNGQIPILTVANLKGGVGKTTLVANLAAYFEKRKQKRVLLFDFDYQGSLTAMMAQAANFGREPRELAVKFLKAGATIDELMAHPESLHPTLPLMRIVTATDELVSHEMKLMLDWFLSEDRAKTDVRYRLRQYLSSERFQNEYDLIIIDTPPRFTTAFVSSLCVSTHVLVPTIFNPLSAIAVGRFVKQLDHMREIIFPGLKIVGVVGQMLAVANERRPDERSAIETIRIGLYQAGLPEVPVLDEVSIPRRVALVKPGVAYLHDAEVRGFFDRLGSEIAGRIGL